MTGHTCISPEKQALLELCSFSNKSLALQYQRQRLDDNAKPFGEKAVELFWIMAIQITLEGGFLFAN
jgi:hypothetical protein